MNRFSDAGSIPAISTRKKHLLYASAFFSYICFASVIHFASLKGEYNTTETARFQYHFRSAKISLRQRRNITKYLNANFYG